MARSWMATAMLLLAAGGSAACGDDDGGGQPDAGRSADAAGADAAAAGDAAAAEDAASGDAAATACGASIAVIPLPGSGQVTGSIGAGAGELSSATCGGAGAEVVYEITVDAATALSVALDPAVDAALYLRSECLDPGAELACDDGGGRSLFMDRLEPGVYYLIVDGANPASDLDFALATAAYIPDGEPCEIRTDACAPGLICDASGGSGPVCAPEQCEVTGPLGGICEPESCSDGVDNDGDGVSDYPFDPGCRTGDDPAEGDACPGEPCPQCANGRDDDFDGDIDYPADRDCVSAAQYSEEPVVCRNGLDDDGDGLIDLGDPGCAQPTDGSEEDGCPLDPTCPACSDTRDNDGDGLTDRPDEPGCAWAGDPDESDICPDGFSCPDCSNGIDDDQDGDTDYPADSDCPSASTSVEGIFCQNAPWPVRPVAGPILSGTTGDSNSFDLGSIFNCYYEGDGDGPDHVYLFRVPGGLRRVTVDSTGSDGETIVALFDGGCLDIKDCEEPLETSTVGFEMSGDVMIVVDGTSGLPFDYTVVVHGEIKAGSACDPDQIASGLLDCEPPTSCISNVCQ